MTESGHMCRHKECHNTTASGHRVLCKTVYSRKKQEKKLQGHCTDPVTCAMCKELVGKRTGSKQSKGDGICEHTNNCNRSFSSQSNCSRHELHAYHEGCTDKCQCCKDIEKKEIGKKLKEMLEAVSRQEVKKRLQEQEEEIKGLTTRLESISWDEIIAKDQSKEGMFIDKAKALLCCLAPQQSFGATIAEIVKGEASFICFLQEKVEKLKAYLPQPTINVLLAYKDTAVISDDKWKHTMSIFSLDDTTTLYHLK